MPIFAFKGEIAAADVEVHIEADALEDTISIAGNGCYAWLSVNAGGTLLRGHRFQLDDEALVRVNTHEPPLQFNNSRCPYCEGRVGRGSFDQGGCAECVVDLATAAAANERIAARLERNQEQQIAAADDLLAKALQRRGPPKALHGTER
jgi:hypothetical protein